MIEFWLCAGLLILAALGFLLIPVVRARKFQAEEDRTALNVTLYQERLKELETQQAAGVLTVEQLQDGRDEAARELLADTEGRKTNSRVLGSKVPLIMALLMPLLGYGMYMHWGAIDQVEETLAFADQPRSIEDMTARLQQAVKDKPDSAEAWYFLGRTLMAQERAGEAANAFEKAVDLAGRDPSLIGQWAQAIYFAGDKTWTPQLQSLTDEALKADPAEVTSLGLLGIAAFEEGRYNDAIDSWEKLVAALPDGDPSRQAIQGGIERARAQLDPTTDTATAEPEVAEQSKPAADSGPTITVKVTLAADLKDQVQPTDSVFIFARAVSGPPMPLAVKRMTVAQLPAEVTLTDADAMMPMLKISGYDQVQLVARISRSGNATQGEWVALGKPLASSTTDTQQLTIDTADGKAQ